MENGVITTEDIILSERYAKKRVFQKWWLRTKNRRNNALCVEFLRKRLNDLIATTCPTSQSICATLGLLPRSERKRVLFRFWYDQACSLYMPRSFRLGTLLMRWRYRTYKLCSAKFAEAHYRSMTKRKVWSRWCKHTQLRNNAISNGLHSSPIFIEKTLSAPIPQQVNGEVSLNLVPGPDLCTKETKPMTTRQTQADFTIMEGEGLHPSKKESPKGMTGGSRAPQCEGTPNVAQRLLLPMVTPSPPSTVPAQHPGSAEMATQTAFSSPPSCPATPAGQIPIHVDTEVAVAALLEDRVRLVDRIIALEMKVNEEAVAVQNREREIRDLKQKLNFMVMREECIESTVKDYKQKCEHLQAVVHALRTERRETLLSTMR
ncbi:unnamed protein product [Trypanosoma congolense IL3000]|uniref:WGS project CAEQ00000000 data, annotated contig 2226 n=1 Tax=Trypanosoma congolense (strain IL3000) TaxID=1068625 RepID=F9WCF8_TRYCI|nr:unnamed protein product [Trypanosoma congolense IL3000]